MKIRLEDLTECQQCGVVFNFIHNASKISGVWIATCPVCKHEHELPKDCYHTYVYKENLLKEFEKIDVFTKDEIRFVSFQDALLFIKQAIEQTREETIEEVKKLLPIAWNELSFTGNEEEQKVGYNLCLKEIKQSLKSLINK